MSLAGVTLGAIGGSLIGGSAGVLLLQNGDIMGISGILSNTLAKPFESLRNSSHHWRWIFLSSFALTTNIIVNFMTPAMHYQDERSYDSDVVKPSILAHLLGGLLVGIGTKIANGCTTGHSICGIGRMSPRSLTATMTFTGMGIATRFLISPLRSWGTWFEALRSPHLSPVSPLLGALVMAGVCLTAILRPTFNDDASKNPKQMQQYARKGLGAALSGIMFAGGLKVSGMTQNSKVHDFLCISGFARHTFDPSLVAVMGAGILTSWLSYQFVVDRSNTLPACKCLQKPLCMPQDCKFDVPTNTSIDSQLLSGAVIFGLGWGLTGICPGPALYAAASGNTVVILGWIPAFCIGSNVGQYFKDWSSHSFKVKKV